MSSKHCDSFCISDYNLRNGRKKAPKNFDELKMEIKNFKKYSNCLLEKGYKIGRENDDYTIGRNGNMKVIISELQKSYRKASRDGDYEEYEKVKKTWKTVKKVVKAAEDSASRIITFCVKQVGKKNLESMRKSTIRPTTADRRGNHGWSTYRIATFYDRQTDLFINAFNEFVRKGEAPYGKTPGPNHDVPIPDDIRGELIGRWRNTHFAERKHLRHVDIWNREKKLEPVRDELNIKFQIPISLRWNNPICVFEESHRKVCEERAVRDAKEYYDEAQEKAGKVREDESTIKNAMIIMWHTRGDYEMAIDALSGNLPHYWYDMLEDYKYTVSHIDLLPEQERPWDDEWCIFQHYFNSHHSEHIRRELKQELAEVDRKKKDDIEYANKYYDGDLEALYRDRKEEKESEIAKMDEDAERMRCDDY